MKQTVHLALGVLHLEFGICHSAFKKISLPLPPNPQEILISSLRGLRMSSGAAHCYMYIWEYPGKKKNVLPVKKMEWCIQKCFGEEYSCRLLPGKGGGFV